MTTTTQPAIYANALSSIRVQLGVRSKPMAGPSADILGDQIERISARRDAMATECDEIQQLAKDVLELLERRRKELAELTSTVDTLIESKAKLDQIR